MLTFGNDPALRAQFIAQADHHYEADMLRAGTYGEVGVTDFKGCSIGCYAHDLGFTGGNLHACLAGHYTGLPEWLWCWWDAVFEGLPAGERAVFHRDLAHRIPLGVDLAPVPHPLAVKRIDRMLVVQRVSLNARHGYGVHEAIEQVVAMLENHRRLHEAALSADSAALLALSAATYGWSADSAYSAALLAAYSAADSVDSAADSVDSAARSVDSAARSVDSARSAEYQSERDAMYEVLTGLTSDTGSEP